MESMPRRDDAPRTSTIYDDFDQLTPRRRPRRVCEEPEPPVPHRRRKNTHPVLWGFVCLLCLAMLGAMGVICLPQVLGVRLDILPTIGFVNGSIIAYDQDTYDTYEARRAAMEGETFFPGVSVDGVALGGLTMEQAREKLSAVLPAGGGSFAVTVHIDNRSWLIDSGMVPMTRNLEETLMKAWAFGRQNTTAIRVSHITPLQERFNDARTLAANPVSFATSLSYDAASVRSLTDQIAAQVNVAPVSADVTAFDLNTKTFSFSEDHSGVYLSADELYERVMAQIATGEAVGSVEMTSATIIAEVTKSELMNSFRRISTFSTTTTSNKNRNVNIQLSAAAINGSVVNPGETFSFNRATGQRTAEKGYKEATAISGGATRPEVGGGVCQTSSTLFNAVARANLTIVSRSPHAWPSSYVKEGMDATVNWPNLDFQFRNDTKWPIYIVAWYENKKVTVEIYGMSLGDGVTIDLESRCIQTLKAPSETREEQNTSLPAGTRQVKVNARDGSVWETYQVWYQNGAEVKRELLCTSTYKAYQKTIEWN